MAASPLERGRDFVDARRAEIKLVLITGIGEPVFVRLRTVLVPVPGRVGNRSPMLEVQEVFSVARLGDARRRLASCSNIGTVWGRWMRSAMKSSWCQSCMAHKSRERSV